MEPSGVSACYAVAGMQTCIIRTDHTQTHTHLMASFQVNVG